MLFRSIPESKRLAVLVRINKVPRAARVADAVEAVEVTRKAIAHEDLGRAAHAASVLSFRNWDDLDVATRQEYARNAARAAGIATPPGMFPELEAWLKRDGVVVMADGTLRYAA